MKDTKQIEKGKVTAEELAQMMNRHKVMGVILEDGSTKHYVYLKRPSIKTISAMTAISKQDEIKAMQVLVDDCFLAGSKDWQDDGVLFMALSTQLGAIVTSVKGTLKNL